MDVQALIDRLAGRVHDAPVREPVAEPERLCERCGQVAITGDGAAVCADCVRRVTLSVSHQLDADRIRIERRLHDHVMHPRRSVRNCMWCVGRS